MVWGSNLFPLLIVTASGGFTGLFVYSPGPGAGNLIASVAAQAGTDPYGNAYKPGVVSYSGPTAYSALNNGELVTVGPHGDVSPGVIAASPVAAGILGASSGTASGLDVNSSWVLNSAVNGGTFQVTDASDGNTYDTQRLTLFTTVNQNITSTSNTVITGLSKPVAAGSYHFRGIIRSQQGATNVNQLIGFTGPATSQAIWFYQQSNTSAGGVMSVTTGVSGLSTVGIGYGAVSATNYFQFEGVATFTAAGTFSAVAAEGTAGDSFAVQQGSILELSPVAAS